MPIKAVIFDMGGVLLHMGDDAPRQALARQYHLPLDRIYWAVFDSPSAKIAGVGEISVEQHWNEVANHLHIPIENLPEFQRQFWSADGVDPDMIGFVRSLRPPYKVGLLSNAWDDLRQVLDNRFHITDAFDDIIISAEVGLAKPDPRIYQLAIKRLSVYPMETIFVDDVLENVESAREVGLHAIQFQNKAQALKTIQDTLKNQQ